jgi:hypothetical protein
MIAVLTDPAVGGTFLTWSLHYLAGHEKYYHAVSNSWVSVSNNPLTGKNSHGFKPNQPLTSDTFDLIHSALVNTPTDNFHTIYFHNFRGSTVSADNILKKAISNIACDRTVVLSLADEHRLYTRSYKMRADIVPSWHNPLKTITTDKEAFDDFISYFFQDSLVEWNKLSLTEIWDQREFLALNLPTANNMSIVPNIDLSQENYVLDTMELWNTFDITADNLFNYLGVTINEDRRASWNIVYNQWRKVHYNRMLFVWYFEKIIDYIIKGNDLDLTRFNLDIVQEASIQHELIYNHNLNLKTWQLTKFTNTKQLHQLLEPNLHDLSKSKISSIATQ